MPKPPPTFISLSEACPRVCQAFDCSRNEAEEWLGGEIRSRAIPLIAVSGSPVAIHEETVIDFKASLISRTRRIQTRAIMEEGDLGEWRTDLDTSEVGVRVADLEKLIQPGLPNSHPYTPGDGKKNVIRAAEELTREGDPGGEGFAQRIHERLGSPQMPKFETVKKYIRDMRLDPSR